MRSQRTQRTASGARSGKVFVLFGLLLPVIFGMVGLTVDGGLMMATHVQAQSAADAGATAAAMDLLHGQSAATAGTTATTFVQQYNGLPNATVTVNIPPTEGAHVGNSQYAEVFVTAPVKTTFIPILGVNSTQNVQARAVAGYEPVTMGEGIMSLDPNGNPGLSISGGGNGGGLSVNGNVFVNGSGASAIQLNGSHADIQAQVVDVVGGVNNPSNILPYSGSGPSPLQTGMLPQPDPLANLPTPASGMAGVNLTVNPAPTGNAFNPGIYTNSISINNGTWTFNPGVYILQGASLTINGGSTSVTGNGVMFYTTGSNYNPSSPPDANDGQGPPPSPIPGNPTFGSININGTGVSFTGLNNSSSPFNGMLFYQRRWDTNQISISGVGNNSLNGTIYAKWANFNLSGNGNFGAQVITGTVSLSGNGNITLNYSGKNLGKGNEVFLVE